MLGIMILMFVGGIGLSQAVSDPDKVTLRWLRLGGIIAMALVAVATLAVFGASDRDVANHESRQMAESASSWISLSLAAAALLVVAQLMFAQLAYRKAQRLSALAAYVTTATIVWVLTMNAIGTQTTADLPKTAMAVDVTTTVTSILASLFAAGLLGGFLMTMLFGHAYLTAGGQMTQDPFKRLVLMVATLLVLRAFHSVPFGIWPYLANQTDGIGNVWTIVMIVTRYAVGLLTPGVFTYMVYDCVRRRANQSATGILYVSTVLVTIGEGIALALRGSTGFVF